MKPAVQTYRGETFFQEELQLYVNRASENFDSPYHNHDFVELAYVAEGAGFHHTQGEVHRVRKGQLFYIPLGFSHVFRPVSDDTAKHPLFVYNCLFKPELLDRLSAFSSDPALLAFISSIKAGTQGYFALTDEDGLIEKLFLSLHREFTLRREGFSDYLNASLLQLFIIVQRMRHRIQRQERSPSAASRLTEFDQLLDYVERHCHYELTLAHLATVSGWSERHLQRLFRKHTEQSFNRYLQALRMQKSCELLKATQLKIGVIAEMAGYRDIGSFLAVFKRNTGQTPSRYRSGHS